MWHEGMGSGSNPHAPEQERLFSNIGHPVEGGIITEGGALLMRDVLWGDTSYGEAPSKVLAREPEGAFEPGNDEATENPMHQGQG
ncbi:MAG: hypothetical protein H0V60_02305 [Actinobacteria bacterium]|nr:hypothetical protein [Actinomycetota bacterium]